MACSAEPMARLGERQQHPLAPSSRRHVDGAPARRIRERLGRRPPDARSGRRPGAQAETPASSAKELSWRTAWRARSLLSRTNLSSGRHATRAEGRLLLCEAGVSAGLELVLATDEKIRAAMSFWCRRLHRQSMSALTGRAPFPLTAFAFAIACQEQPATRAAECRNARDARAPCRAGATACGSRASGRPSSCQRSPSQ